MIGRLNGVLIEKNPPQILVEAAGVGYEVDVPMSTFYELPAEGEAIILYTHLAVREDGQFLYGFRTNEERSLFRLLIKVSGIGARTALALLSGLSVSDLQEAVVQQESGRLIKIPGIGKKTAERLLLELKDKLSHSYGTNANNALSPAGSHKTNVRNDVVSALMALGYNEREAVAAIKGLDAEISVSEGIRQALKNLAKP